MENKEQPAIKRISIKITGIVQGVGFRPTVYRYAVDRNLSGFVKNTSQGVFIEVEGSESSINSFIENLPFKLTVDQVAAIDSIKRDITSSNPMNRLLQGDVGSGKTVVSMAASLLTASANLQVALMARARLNDFAEYIWADNILAS